MRITLLGWMSTAACVIALTTTLRADDPSSRGMAAIGSAAKKQKHLFILFYKQQDTPTQAMKTTLDAALGRRSDEAETVSVCVTDPAEKRLVDHWKLGRSPMPLIMAVAPNGAVTGAFPIRLTEQQIAGAFVSPGMAACLKGAQANKLVLLCVHPAGKVDLPAGVQSFKADGQYSSATEIVSIQSDDKAEAGVLKTFKIRPASTTVTALLAPPGTLLGTFDSTVTKQQLVKQLNTAQNSCCPGGKCGPGGCCPPGKVVPRK